MTAMGGAPQDFGGFDLAIGSVNALRWFDIDTLGRLRAVSYSHVWTPGENVAECHATDRGVGGMAAMMTTFARGMTIPPYLYYPSPTPTPICGMADCLDPNHQPSPVESTSTIIDFDIESIVDAERHAAPDPACRCGFYAYADKCDAGTYGGPPDTNALGVIECYGKTVIGAKGVRCEKAIIRGLVTTNARTRRFYPDAEHYETRDQLIDAFTLVEAQYPTPESDDKFWTRPA